MRRGTRNRGGFASELWTAFQLSIFAVALALASGVSAAAPVITSFSPSNGQPGDVISIHGTNFSPVRWENTVQATSMPWVVLSATSTDIEAVVPRNASAGNISVTVAGETGTSADTFFPAPYISNISPPQAFPGTSLTIRGGNFALGTANNVVLFNGVPATVTAATSFQLTVTLPATATSGFVTVTTNGMTGTSNIPYLVGVPGPIIYTIAPSAAKAGTVVALEGKGFGTPASANVVTFNGVAATVASASSTSLSVTVPAGATSGVVAVTVNGVTGVSPFLFYPVQAGGTLQPDGPSISVSTTTAGQAVDIPFQVSAGQNLGLGVTGVVQTPLSSSHPSVAILKPDGSQLSLTVCTASCVFDLGTLAVAGTYTVRLSPVAAGSNVSANVSLTQGTQLSFDSTASYSVPLDRLGRKALIRFTANAGESRGIDLIASYPLIAFPMGYEVRRPNGTLLVSDGVGQSCFTSCGGPLFLHNLPDTGEYTLLLKAATEKAEMLRASLRVPAPVPLDGAGVPQAADFSGEAGLYSFESSSAPLSLAIIMPVTVDYVSASYPQSFSTVKIYGPDGTQLNLHSDCLSITRNFYLSDGYADEGCGYAFDAPQPGSYLVRITPNRAQALSGKPSDFRAWLSSVRDVTSTIDGPPALFDTDRPGQTMRTTFTGLAGQTVQFQDMSPPTSANLIYEPYYPFQVIAPDGSAFASFVTNVNGVADLPTFTTWGTFTLQEAVVPGNPVYYKVYDRPLRLPFQLESLTQCALRAFPITTAMTYIGNEPATPMSGSSFVANVSVTANIDVCGAPTGTVSLNDSQNNSTCTYSIPAESGCTLTAGTRGLHSLSATFTPADTTMFSATSKSFSNVLTVQGRPSSVAVTGISPEPSIETQYYTASAAVAGQPDGPTPLGPVSMSDGVSSCTFYLPATGCSIYGASQGTRTVTASYLGDQTYAPSVSSGVAHVINQAPPTITGFSPTSATGGSSVSITGTNFGTTAANVSVTFNGVPAVVLGAYSTSVVATLPATALTGPVTVTVGSLSATSSTAFITKPTISTFAPTSGNVGVLVTITGKNFDPNPSGNLVTFNGKAATITSANATQLTTLVPSGATTGKIQIVVGGQTYLTSSNFTVTSLQPQITSFTPTSGPTGTSVTINGSNFNTTPAADTVTFNGAVASVTSATTTKLIAVVPSAASTGLIGVAVGTLSATSATPFTLTATAPTITTFTPISGAEGVVVTVTGTSFSPNAASNGVSVGGTAAVVLDSSATQLRILVPANATSGPISVTTNGMTGTSTASFSVVQPGNGTSNVTVDSVSVEPGVVGQPYVVYAIVTAVNPATPTPTGAVAITNGAHVCFVNLPEGQCTLTESVPGETALQVIYTGDATFARSYSGLRVHLTNPTVPTEVCGLDPYAIDSDPPSGTPLNQMSGISYSPGIETSITGSGVLSVTIDPSLQSSTVHGSTLDVFGTFDGPLNTGITVNGVVGHTSGNQFLVPAVPLEPGANTLVATATLLAGTVATSPAIVVTSDNAEPSIALHVTSPVQFVPASALFDYSLASSLTATLFEIDADGDGTFDYSATVLESLPQQLGIRQSGLIRSRFRATLASGQTIEATATSLLEQPSTYRGMLCDLHGYLKQRLAADDLPGALNVFNESTRSYFSPLLSPLSGQSLQDVSASLGYVMDGTLLLDSAYLLLMRDTADGTRAGYPATAQRDADGVWRLSDM